MALFDAAIVFVVNLLIGGFGIYAGSKLVTGKADYSYSIVTALLGAVIWSITAFFVGFIPLIGPLLTFLAYLAVINARIEGGWIDALLVSAIAWISVAVVLSLIAVFSSLTFAAIGVPGV